MPRTLTINAARGIPSSHRKVLATKSASKSAPSTGGYYPSDEESLSEEEHRSRKRSSTAVSIDDVAPKKLIKLTGEARIRELEEQVLELQNFIVSKGLALDAPPSIRRPLEARNGAAKEASNTLRNKIYSVYSDIADQTYNARKSGVTSDDVSQAMREFLPEIERLAELPDGLQFAFELTLYLGEHYYAELDDGGCGYDDRTSDKPADKLLVRLAKWMKEEVVDFKFDKAVEDLKRQAKLLADYGINGFSPKSIELMSTWVEQGSQSPEQPEF